MELNEYFGLAVLTKLLITGKKKKQFKIIVSENR